ncbi:hypothetical protein [Arthrobacter globiformis]|uniref:hypothetical protein n=1 Tax=Arthrobacter globiformis TaxID=1665 RepID=UPI00278CCC93|nr:hypothetical protein [Arthrobacter globiformis]MDQ0617403.1 threonine dehydrogenase-like Zn-dependent dehydrogenase [Arthrobacter globiformis]
MATSTATSRTNRQPARPATIRAAVLPRHWPLAIQLIAAGRVNLDILVTRKFTLAQSEEAPKAGKQPGQLKAVVYPGR